MDRNSDIVCDSSGTLEGRICRLTKRKDFDGYGFVLHSRKKAVGHYVTDVEVGSPAERSGVLVGDRLISVNGICVRDHSHKQVDS
jgi:sodium/hydrogen exchange regulatory cofactor NHE-RF1